MTPTQTAHQAREAARIEALPAPPQKLTPTHDLKLVEGFLGGGWIPTLESIAVETGYVESTLRGRLVRLIPDPLTHDTRAALLDVLKARAEMEPTND